MSGIARHRIFRAAGDFSRRQGFRGLRILRRFARHEHGATAVEFGMVALPFLAMMFAIIETALVFLAGQTLETAATNSARKIMTGQAETWDLNKFKQEVCTHVYGLFDCNKIQVNVQAYSSFGAANMQRPVDANGNIVTGFNPGKSGDVVVARLMYDWPVFIPKLDLADSDRPNGTRMLIATVAFRNEPW